MESVKLNLGAGDQPLPGYVNMDRKTGDEVFPISRESESADCVRASHVLEHFSHRQTLDVLKEWTRVLKPGGVLKVAVPDANWIIDRYINGDTGYPLEGYLFGGHTDDDDKHGAMFNEQKLRALMKLAGLGDVRRWESEIDDCAKLPVSLNLMGTKGAPEYPVLTDIVAGCFSMPRLTFSDFMFCAMKALSALRIPTLRKSGVFWGQCLQGVFEMSLERKIPYLLTMDYDSVFTVDDVVGLYRLMEAHPEADAICSLQAGRERATPLMTVANPDGTNRAVLDRSEMANDLLELRTGHFGLTMIRADALRKMPKPWFMHTPDKDGGWGDGRVDDDIYFWLKFRECGLRLFQANRICVGHTQLVVSWPNRDLVTEHQYAAEYEAGGKPEGAWL